MRLSILSSLVLSSLIFGTGCDTENQQKSTSKSEVTSDSNLDKSLYEEVKIPSGNFEMGCTSEQGSDCFDGEKGMHRVVSISRSFYLMKSEVTQELYKKVMGENPSNFKGSKRPVDSVNWYDAVRFANKLSKLEGREECYQIGSGSEPNVSWSDKSCNGWRLPTEAEWEYAARGNQNYKYAGSNNLDDVGWYDGNSYSNTHDVCGKEKNGFGLCDMIGNVWEWVWDWYHGDYRNFSKTDPVGTIEHPHRLRRGGSWRNNARHARVSRRGNGNPTYRENNFGFRVLRVAE